MRAFHKKFVTYVMCILSVLGVNVFLLAMFMEI